MGRTRAYVEKDVLRGAMQAFRRKGYQAVSIRDLETATGLKAGSIYNSFGDKAALFDAAFAHYNRAVLRYRIDRFAPPSAGLGGLRDLFRSLLHEPNRESFGCLITNSAVELGGAGSSHPSVREGFKILTDTFRDRLTAARRSGLLRRGIEPVATATKLLALYQGILVLVRGGHDKKVLEEMLMTEFNNLEVHHDA